MISIKDLTYAYKRSGITAANIAQIALILMFAAVILYVSYLKQMQLTRNRARANELPLTEQRAVPVIEAIQGYIRQHGKPPPSLEALLPTFLKSLPYAGTIAKNGWHYTTNEDKQAGGWSLLVWVRNEYSPNINGFGDRFVYRPSGQYPPKGYGGILMPVDKWGYYVE